MLNALIVDDEAPARSELRFLLEETGRINAISEASNAREAVEKLVRSKEGTDERTDVLFMDISMPKTSGMQLAEALHKLKNPPAVVFVTAYSEYAVEAFSVDAVDYLLVVSEYTALGKKSVYKSRFPCVYVSNYRYIDYFLSFCHFKSNLCIIKSHHFFSTGACALIIL